MASQSAARPTSASSAKPSALKIVADGAPSENATVGISLGKRSIAMPAAHPAFPVVRAVPVEPAKVVPRSSETAWHQLTHQPERTLFPEAARDPGDEALPLLHSGLVVPERPSRRTPPPAPQIKPDTVATPSENSAKNPVDPVPEADLLARVVTAWPHLEPSIQAAILAMVQVAEMTAIPTGR